MQTSEYWRKRTLLVEEALHNKSAEYYRTLHDQYRLAARKTEQEVSVLYNRLAVNNGISMTEAKRLLNTRELDEFRWNVNEYIKYGKDNAISGQWMKQLENASLRYRISRLEAMKIQMQHYAECVFSSELDGMTKLLTDVYTDGYYRTAHLIETGFGLKHTFAQLDKRRIDMVISKPWAADGTNFSKRIWGNHRPALINDLHTGLTQAIIRGQSPDELIKHIGKRYDVAASKAGNLVMTESAYFGNASQQECYKELDVEMQQFCATLDTRTSEMCRSMDLKIIKSSDVEVGVNAPPLHCRCRSVMIPYFDDMEGETRIARDKDGRNITVPGNMSYDEWYNQYIKGTKADKTKRSKPTTFKGKVDDIKQDLTGHQSTLAKQQSTLANKNRILKDTRREIPQLEMDRDDLEMKRTQYNTLKNINLDRQFDDMTAAVEEWQAKVDELNAQHDKWYARPERGTSAYDEWKAWRDGIDFEKLFNDLTEAQLQLGHAKGQVKYVDGLRKFMRSTDIDDLEKKLADLNEKLVSKRNEVATLANDIAHLTDDIADTRLTIENTYRRAGKEFISELDNVKFITDEDVEKLREKREAVWREYLDTHDYTKKPELYEQYKLLNEELKELRQRMPIENAETITSLVGQVRSIGASSMDDLVKKHLGSSRSKVRAAVVDAYSHYPTEWVDASIAMGELSLKKVDRGYYSHSFSVMAISGYDDSQQFRTAIHEIGHRFERAVPELLEIEKTFYDRRTKGEPLQWLGDPYAKTEKSRFDDFFNKYIGKDYGGTAYEVVSMGFEYGYTEPLTLLKDKEMAELIYGLLLMK